VYRQILIDVRLKAGNRGQKTERTGRKPLRRGRSEMNCSAIEEEEEEEGEEEEEKKKKKKEKKKDQEKVKKKK